MIAQIPAKMGIFKNGLLFDRFYILQFELFIKIQRTGILLHIRAYLLSTIYHTTIYQKKCNMEKLCYKNDNFYLPSSKLVEISQILFFTNNVNYFAIISWY